MRAARRRRPLAPATVATPVGGSWSAGCGRSARRARGRAPAAASASRPRWRPPSGPDRRARLGRPRHLALWAPVKRPAAVRAGAGRRRAVVGHARRRTTPEGTRNVVAVLGRRQDRRRAPRGSSSGSPVLPNGSTGWVPRRALGGYGTVQTRLVVDLERAHARRCTATAGPCSCAPRRRRDAPRSPTPRGRLLCPQPAHPLSQPDVRPGRLRTSARSPDATDWPAGGFVGIHGTDRPDLVPGRVSHGCIRFRNADILALARRMPVGTPVTIR